MLVVVVVELIITTRVVTAITPVLARMFQQAVDTDATAITIIMVG